MTNKNEVRFGRWLVLRPSEKNTSRRHLRCRCDCGTERDVLESNLLRGGSNSCGCLNDELSKSRFTKHGLIKTRTYRTWRAMRQRCSNKKLSVYPYYGGRGISVCLDWGKSFMCFLADMGPAPDGMSLDRIDNNKNYEPGNCRWATTKEQANNKRSNVTFEGKTLAQWADLTGLSESVLHHRYKRSGSIYRTNGKLNLQRQRNVIVEGKTIPEWSLVTGLARSVFYERLKRSGSIYLKDGSLVSK